MSMMKPCVELPLDRLEQMRQELRSELNQPDTHAAKEVYARLIANISNPASSELVQVVRGSKWLQVSLNAIILWRRASWLLYIGILFLAIVKSWWLLLLAPLLWVTNNIGLNHFQTMFNVELAARLFLLNVLVDEDAAFRDHVFSLMEGQTTPHKL